MFGFSVFGKIFFVLVHNYLAGFQLQVFNKLSVGEQCENSS